jgi:hypothetical protein
MKTSLTIVSLLAGAAGVYSQGLVQWEAYSAGGGSTLPISVEVYSPQTSGPPLQYGNGPGDIPRGTTIYTGVPLGGSATGPASPTDYANGNLWSIALYAAPGDGDDASALTPVAGATETFATMPNDAGQWTVPATSAIIPGTGIGGPATLQLYVWYNGGPANLTYAEALAAGDPTAVSPLLDFASTGALPAAPPTLASGGMTSFNIASVPEPGTIALVMIGAYSFLLHRRKPSSLLRVV